MLELGVLEPSVSSWASPLVLITKKDGKPRFCVDYRQLNTVTVRDAYPLPRIDDTLELLQGAKYFTTLDLASGYWQLALHPDDREKTAVVSHFGLFQFTVLPFGLTNAPATFERFMETQLKGCLGKTCLVYLDDIIVFGRTATECLDRLEEVLSRLIQAGLKLKATKCRLLQTKIHFLGHVVSNQGIETDPEKIQVVQQWKTPLNLTQLRSFMGFCSYYRTFVKDFSTRASPLNRLMQKDADFNWTPECQEAMEDLKGCLTRSPILAFPREKGALILDTEAVSYTHLTLPTKRIG